MTSNLCGTGKVWVMGFYRDMGYPCKPSRWIPKFMGYYRLWVIREMGYDRVDCILQFSNPIGGLISRDPSLSESTGG